MALPQQKRKLKKLPGFYSSDRFRELLCLFKHCAKNNNTEINTDDFDECGSEESFFEKLRTGYGQNTSFIKCVETLSNNATNPCKEYPLSSI